MSCELIAAWYCIHSTEASTWVFQGGLSSQAIILLKKIPNTDLSSSEFAKVFGDMLHPSKKPLYHMTRAG